MTSGDMAATAPHRALGGSGLAIAPLVLGGNVFGWTADRDASFAILDAFVDGGGTMIDTADVYSAWAPGHHGGESEAMIGEWLRTSGKRDAVLIATKVGMHPPPGEAGLSPDRIARGLEASLRRLGTDRIDLYFAHADDGTTPLHETLAAFDALVRAGKVRALGASNYSAARLEDAIRIAGDAGLTPYTVLQPHYNLVERAGFEDDLLLVVQRHDIGVVPYYGLASGFLTGKYREPADLTGARAAGAGHYLDDRGRRVLAAMDAVAARHDATLAQVALAWLMARPGITAPIASATSTAQLADLLGAMRLTLAPDDLHALDRASA